MLAHSPPLPLVIDHADKDHDISTEDEAGTIHALRHRDRVRRIRLWMPTAELRKLIVAIDGEFLELGYLYIKPLTDDNTCLILPKMFYAPHLRHFLPRNFAIPIGSPFLSTAAGLITLSLNRDPTPCLLPPR
jgi:hypothetical protein